MNRKAAFWIVAAAVIGLLGGAYGGYWAQTRNGAAPAFVPAAAEPATGGGSAIRTTYSGAGAYRVPGQFAAGTYIITAGAGDFGCYWERLRVFDGKQSSVLSTGNASRGGYGRLVVSAKDKGVRMVGDCVWIKL